ncbi:MAG TPA: subclass B3 metallo-beta-lactamase, partial [Rhizomicrobium sp.]|nr:subclass B3 metallo-beta-lactamase [Rhizomicrobium sp.]
PRFAAMDQPVAPFKISDDIYYVGASDVTSFLIVTDAGLILTDGGFPDTAQQIEANIKALGFDIKNVKILMSSHAHFDHAGGLAELKRASGATFVASRGDAPVLKAGGTKDFIDLGKGTRFDPIKVDRFLSDGEQLTLGHTTLIIHLTPGHTRGCTSWSMTTHIDGKPEQVLYICSLTVLPDYRLLGKASYPGIADDFAHSIALLKSLPCDIMLASHGIFFGLTDKRAKMEAGDKTAFVNPDSCKTYLAHAEKDYNDELAKERVAP